MDIASGLHSIFPKWKENFFLNICLQTWQKELYDDEDWKNKYHKIPEDVKKNNKIEAPTWRSKGPPNQCGVGGQDPQYFCWPPIVNKILLTPNCEQSSCSYEIF